MNRRTVILVTVISFSFLAVLFRLSDIMLLNHDWFSAKARVQQIKKEVVPIKRGIIFDRRGRELAINLETESVYSNPSEISSPDDISSVLSKVISQEPDIIFAKLNSDKKFSWIERKLDMERTQMIKDMKIKGIGFLPEMKRFYPKGALASHIIGFVNPDNNGLEGIERKYEKYLSARSENAYMLRDAKGNILSDGLTKEIKGNNIVLTIDEGLQYILEKNLDAAMLKWKAASATAIMMDPYTGEILAMANRPAYNLNNTSEADMHQMRNRAITDCYEPGSTFKIIVGVAALEEGVVNLRSKFDCSAGHVDVGGNRIRDSHRHGVLTFEEIIQKSSNVGTIKVGLSLGKSKIYDYIKKLGFGEKTGIDLAGEVSGIVRPPERWSGMSIGAISIGQEIAVTPLQILRAYSVIANGGFLVKPYVVSEILSPEGKVIYKTVAETERIISEKTINTFRGILKKVTEDGGTAKGASVAGNQVAGKTGTAQIIDPKTKKYSRDKFISSFVGFVPADEPRLAMIVVIHEPKGQIYGGVVAGPVFRAIADEALSYLSVPRDDSAAKGLLLVSSH